MDLPIGMRIAQEFYRSQKWQRKSMCSVYIKGNVMVASFNNMKTHTISARHGDPFHRTHSEMACLKQLRDVTGGYLYIYRERHSGSFGHSRPCRACLSYVKSRGIKEICYFTPEGNIAWEKINYGVLT